MPQEGDPSDPFGLNAPVSTIPQGSRIVFTPHPTGGTFTREPATAAQMWREVLVPAVVLAILGAGLGWLVRRLLDVGWREHLLLVAGVAGGSWLWMRVLRDALQNGGVVTEIDVRDGSLHWTKQNLWGSSRRQWPLQDIRDVQVAAYYSSGGAILKIHRRTGMPLGAFAGYSDAELQAVARVLQGFLRS